MSETGSASPKTAILLMAHGAPNSVDDIPLYLKNIRGGTESSPEVVQLIKDRYRAIGGSSPLLEITRAQAKALENFLNQQGDQFKVYVGMRNWSPYIRDAVKEALADGVEKIVALCLAPQYSKWSTERYLMSFRDALKECGAENMDVQFISTWSNQPRLIDAFADRYNAALKKIRAKNQDEVATVFTIHSIPEGSVELDGDPYVEEYKKTVEGIVDSVHPSPWYQAYQSQGMIPVPWLVPRVEETLDKISAAGGRTALLIPVGFVSDHIEILYDIDIAFKEYAAEKNIDLWRTESLNDSPIFIETLAAVIWEHLA